MALTRQNMTDEQRKSVALEYLKAFDNGGVTSTGGSILDLFADDAQVYFPNGASPAARSRSASCSVTWGERGAPFSTTTPTSTGFSPERTLCVRGHQSRRARGRSVARRRAGVGRGAMVRCIRGP
jgi:hypothetical protein